MNPIIVNPATPVIDLARAKLHCKITSSDRDVEVTDAVATAQAWVQVWLGVAIGEQRLSWRLDSWTGCYTLPYDVTSVVGVTAAGDAVAWVLRGRTLHAAPDSATPVVITVDCGLAAAQVPPPVKSAMLLIVGDLTENQQAASDMQLYENPAVDRLLALYSERLPL